MLGIGLEKNDNLKLFFFDFDKYYKVYYRIMIFRKVDVVFFRIKDNSGWGEYLYKGEGMFYFFCVE